VVIEDAENIIMDRRTNSSSAVSNLAEYFGWFAG
jgi:hypothetical protein